MSIILMIGLTVGDRVRECRRSRKWSQAELAKRASVSQVTISHVENNMSDQSKFLPQLASALGVSSEYLLSGKEYIEKNKGSLEDFVVIGGGTSGEIPSKEEYCLIPKFSVSGSCGSGSIIENVDIKGGLVFSQSWIAAQGLNEESLVVISAVGDSMYPTIENDQVLLVDTNDKVVRSSKIYFLCIDGKHYIKRLINMITHWVVRSDNPDKQQYPDIEISSENMNLIQVEGRVVWRGGSL